LTWGQIAGRAIYSPFVSRKRARGSSTPDFHPLDTPGLAPGRVIGVVNGYVSNIPFAGRVIQLNPEAPQIVWKACSLSSFFEKYWKIRKKSRFSATA
jgi:hypothetical protein